ncbi:MAG: endonuclease/exonuclease/phosphatase family protein [Muribaculum sp.]|nr:endonuclease/exonuclease/phosphatase family protein [Muribaculaceae bacterium]MCM1081241.1 endonuclease/exonuclease/phosphatase family protein [Muribaculum sp.]
MKSICFFLTLLIFEASCSLAQSNVKVMQLNVWMNTGKIEGGFEAMADEIARHKPDLVSLNEINSSESNPIHKNLLEALELRGVKYYGAQMQQTEILSLTPLCNLARHYPDSAGVRGSIVSAQTTINGQKFTFFSAHLDYKDDAYYNVRGYDGSTWEPCPIPSTVEDILRRNDMSRRDDGIRKFIEAARGEVAKRRHVIVAGDFNEPSHLDWIDATANLYDHHGFVVPWTCTTLLEQAGYADSYRVVHPNPLTHPGFTFPASNDNVAVDKLTWAPEADERDRIDYVFYHGDSGLKAVKASLLGPDKSICRSLRVSDNSDDTIFTPLAVWPTDHRGLLIEFQLP